ncbi:pimeloyl-ACP methyl ester carboxylesterase [Arcanobacterium pluranimalium]|uniref:alpha/beta hydrolase family protein n=1 Tax=Arcanobacterium pluranimalium TaxID=108028 RepID=UPI00195AA6E8|nr:hypothetical protein [Arcanobacterium pluranimalium]MBM7824844.1 pimeloyl-ACP methyl ester carboxylesterase [Arcanobacterium pluranimalium]
MDSFAADIEKTPEKQVLENLLALDVASEEIERYGVHPDQYIEWYGPEDGKVICFIHGGFFHEDGTLRYLRPSALSLGEVGYRIALPEFRRIPGNPAVSLEDMATLARHPQLAEATWLGHSAGSLNVLNVLFDTELRPSHGVVLAPIFDLRRDAEETPSLSSAATIHWLGGTPAEIPDVYQEFDPAVRYARLGADGFSSAGYRLDIIHGALDATIPVQRTRDLASEPFNIAIVPDANHNDVIRPGHDAWLLLLGALG